MAVELDRPAYVPGHCPPGDTPAVPRLAASYPNPDVNDLLASVNELSQLLFEHPMHTLVQMLLANARAMSDDESLTTVNSHPTGPALMKDAIRHVRQVLATWRGMLEGMRVSASVS